MGSIKLKIHPLFFLFGLFYALTGRITVFVVYTLCAVIHELGHSLTASSLGYKLDKIYLMPFGAMVKGEIDGLKIVDEIKVALAGPMVNLLISALFVALWWVFPETYAYTEMVVTANLSLGLINLLPTMPLDGGRVLTALINKKLTESKTIVVCRILALVFGSALVCGFVFSIYNQINFSLLFFALFIVVGAFSKKSQGKYVKTYSNLAERKLKSGIEIKRQAVSDKIILKKLLSLVDDRFYNEFVVFSNGQKSVVIGGQEVLEILQKGSIYDKLEKYL